MDTIIRGGTIVTAFETFRADIGIEAGKVVELASHVSVSAPVEVNAADKLVLPGLIDSSVFFTPGTDGVLPADTFEAGTAAAAAGGVTTVINQVWCRSGRSVIDTLRDTLEEVAPLAGVDFSFHALVEPNESLPGEVFDLVYFGVPSLRLTGKRSTGTTGYDGILFAVLREASRCGALVGVTPANSEVTDFLAGTYLSEAKISPDYHGRSWPAFLEKESVVKAAVYAEATASHVHVFGLSTAAGLQEIEQARVKGVQITCETHPYYLLLTKERMYDEQEGSIYITAPPLREEQDVTRLWLGLRTGSVQTVSSGHRGLWRSQKREPLTFADIPPGLGCIEAMLPLLYSEGVIRNLISPERLVEMLSYNPACLFGLYPEKGTVAVGADADLIIFDPRRTSVLSLESLHGKSDVQPFADWDITGAVEMTFLRGQVVYHNGEVLGSPGTGRFVKRIPLE